MRTIGHSQQIAASIWDQFKTRELSYADMLELVAVLLVNVADKSESSDAEIIRWTTKLVHDMRVNGKIPSPK